MSIETIKSEPSSRYYTSEIVLFVSNAILFLTFKFGFNNISSIPYLNYEVTNNQTYLLILSSMIVLVAIYLVLEFIISYKSTFHFFNKIRIVLPISISIITLWVVYPTIVRHSIFESISPVWFILSLANGIIIGNFINSIVYGLLVIRSKQESIQKGLPIVPISVKIVITLNSFLILIFLYFPTKEICFELLKE